MRSPDCVVCTQRRWFAPSNNGRPTCSAADAPDQATDVRLLSSARHYQMAVDCACLGPLTVRSAFGDTVEDAATDIWSRRSPWE
jgi:hypothetical protein